MNKQKGISQIVVMVVMLVLAVALPLTTNLVKKSQENRSKAFPLLGVPNSTVTFSSLGRDDLIKSGEYSESDWKNVPYSDFPEFVGTPRTIKALCIMDKMCASGNCIGNQCVSSDSNCNGYKNVGCDVGYSCKLKKDNNPLFLDYKCTCDNLLLNGVCSTSTSSNSNSTSTPSTCAADSETVSVVGNSGDVKCGNTTSQSKTVLYVCGSYPNISTGGTNFGWHSKEACYASGKTCSNGACVASGSTVIVQDSKCVNAGGVCQKTTTACTNGKTYLTNYCMSSGSDVKCCAPATVLDKPCTDKDGVCKVWETSTVGGSCNGGTGKIEKGLCMSKPTDTTYRCCVPNSIPTYTIYTKGSCNTSTGKYSCTSSTSTTAPNGSTTFSDKEKCEDYTGCNQTTYTIFTKGSCNTSTGNWVCTKNSASSTAANGTTTFSSEALCGAVTGCDIACTTANWTSALSPTTCPSTGKQTKTWTKTGTCTGGVTHPATETVDCDPGYTAPKLTMQVSMLGVFAGANDKCLDQQMKLKVNVSKAGDAGITREMIATKVDDKFSTVKVVNDGYQVYEIKDFELDNTYLLTDKIYIYVTNIKDSHLKLLTTLYGRNEQTGGFVSGDTSLIKVSDLVDKTLTLYNWSILNGDIDGNGSIDGFDFAAMKNEWNKEVATNGVLKSDLNGDCYVNGLDLQIYKNSLEKQFSAKSLN
ncbi:MAG: dockerin type I domain-containing protein [Candidatus Shapirobacteria bacterium]|nr:dockerin type I domain-containing protein [Candidatus Shapirobacteria bacterium]